MAKVKCPNCYGNKKCSPCNGGGYIGKGSFERGPEVMCDLCRGTGKCHHCGGRGEVDK